MSELEEFERMINRKYKKLFDRYGVKYKLVSIFGEDE